MPLKKTSMNNTENLDKYESLFSAEVITQTLDKVSDGLIFTDPHLQGNPIIYASTGFFELTGYGPDEVIGRNCCFLQGNSSSRDTINEIKRSISEKISFKGKIINYKKNGEPFINLLRIEPIFKKGELRYFLGSQINYLI